MSTITIVGAGMMGSAMSVPARANRHTVRIVGTPLDREIIEHARATGEHLTLKRRLPDEISYYQIEELDSALAGADLLVCGVSSFGLDWFIENIIPKIPESLPVLSVTKGMMNIGEGRLISYPEVFEASTKKKISFNAIGGPCTSYELADRDPTVVTFCGRDISTLRWIKSLFETDFYHISLSTDVRGVECAVALKNAYALGVCLAIGLSYRRQGREFEHYNSQAALFGQSVREMSRLLDLCGGRPDNIMLGAGDLYVTVFGGRTRKIGILLGSGLPFDEAMKKLAGITLESVVIARRTTTAVRELIAAGRAAESDFPLILHVDAIIRCGEPVNIPWRAFETETII
ncbi:MAG TPA: glycerol-3-phosphate dehydrogenase [Clostridiales bacterium]|jgi:glycerol-3-phosphate dehydrogenase (NAD(P)+)|nr:glycerol-3-phosphate dehydrogenase [Clostridiales bacterium]